MKPLLLAMTPGAKPIPAPAPLLTVYCSLFTAHFFYTIFFFLPFGWYIILLILFQEDASGDTDDKR
jgi:hypothetical protein